MMQAYFHALADSLAGMLAPGESFACTYAGERSDFVRLNRNRVRQAGHVIQRELELDLVKGERHAAASLDLSADPAADRAALRDLVGSLRGLCRHVPPDPFLNYAAEPRSSEVHRGGPAVDSARALDEVVAAADGLDLVGILANGTLERGFAASNGQRNWHSVGSFNLDFSAYLRGDKAVKGRYAGFQWEPSALAGRMQAAREALALLDLEPVTLAPGRYRAYLAPAALHEILGMLAWGGFSLKSQRTRQSPLIGMTAGDRRLHPAVTLTENHAEGLAPGFTGEGFHTPPRVTLIEAGAYGEPLAGARSAKEYGVSVNAACEAPRSLDLAPGTLAADDVLAALDTGVYVSNLWYCNFSDRNECRITGMTRYACFWVEGGRIRGPVNVMRFDDSAYRMLGERLVDLTAERELIFDPDTYERRSVATARLPGALIDELILSL